MTPFAAPQPAPAWERVNDVHAQLNPTDVCIVRPTSTPEVIQSVHAARRDRRPMAVCGARHAMGGQQFLNRSTLLDTRAMNRVLHVDHERGTVSVQAGIQWPELIAQVLHRQHEAYPDRPPRWGIRQKQTGADTLTLGGSLAANIHGRGLRMPPIVADVESFAIVDAVGQEHLCSRDTNADLFALAIGGYGLFGVITEVTLRLAPRRTLRRVVRVIDIEDAVPAAERRIREGFVYGDFQFDVNPESPTFLTKGVFSGYVPVDGDPEPPAGQRVLSREAWLELLTLAHTDKSRAFLLYAQHYLATDGQLYKSDTHQLSDYADGYHAHVDRVTGSGCPGSEMITELYVPPDRLIEFLRAAAHLLSESRTQVIYGTIRLIQPDTETVLAWARERFACVIFNLHVDHEPAAIERAADAFRALIDLATALAGSYYLTYHRYASPAQVERCYPRVREFFAAKARCDPEGVFQSDWHRHYAPHFERVTP